MGKEYESNLRTVDVHIRRLREKLSLLGKESYIKTKWGKGYYFSTKDVDDI